jgi:hypothetical protein
LAGLPGPPGREFGRPPRAGALVSWRPDAAIMSGLSGTANNGVIAPGCG